MDQGPTDSISSNVNPFIESLDDISLLRLIGSKPYEGDPELVKPYGGLLSGYSIEPKIQKEGSYIQFSKTSDGKYLIGGRKTALVIPTVNRPNDLIITLMRVIDVLKRESNIYTVDLFIAQDGENQKTTTAIDNLKKKVKSEIPFCPIDVIVHKKIKLEVESGYLRLSSHFHSIFDTLFVTKKYDQVILLEVLLVG